MSVDLQETIQKQVRVLSDDELKRVLKFMQNLRKEKSEQQTKPISAIFEDLSTRFRLKNGKNCLRTVLKITIIIFTVLLKKTE